MQYASTWLSLGFTCLRIVWAGVAFYFSMRNDGKHYNHNMPYGRNMTSLKNNACNYARLLFLFLVVNVLSLVMGEYLTFYLAWVAMVGYCLAVAISRGASLACLWLPLASVPVHLVSHSARRVMHLPVDTIREHGNEEYYYEEYEEYELCEYCHILLVFNCLWLPYCPKSLIISRSMVL